MITKRKLLDHYKTQVEIANLFGITEQAISRWPMDEPIPKARLLELRYELAPALFTDGAAFADEPPCNDESEAAA